jgi:hemolysin activation/secretion protein
MWIGDLLSFEYQFSNQFKRLQSYTLNYTSFLPWKHILTIFGSYATVKPTPVAPAIDIRAKAAQIRPRYTIPFKPFYTPFQQSLIFGFDLKNSNSSIINLSGSSVVVQPTLLPAEKTNINVFQLVGDYNFYNKVGNHSFSVDMSFYASPAQFLPNQSNENYNSLTKNSKVKYCYLNATIGDVITIPKIMAISVLMRGQVSSDTLPGTELFSLGGYDTIRGYHESESAVDNGFIGNLEFRTRPFSFFRKLKDQLLFLAFLDFGVGNNWFVQKKTEAGAKQIPHTQYLLGVGPGLRYTINPHIQIRCDYGFKLHHLLISDPSQQPLLGGFGQFHLGVLASY